MIDEHDPKQEFEAALRAFKDSLSPQEALEFEFATPQDVYREIDRIQKEQETKGLLRNMKRLKPFMDGLTRFSGVIEQFVAMKPAFLGFIWGPVKFLLNVSHTYIKSFDIILNALRAIGDSLPRFESFAVMFKSNPRIREVLGWLFGDILEFYAKVLKFFRKKAWKQFFCTMWSDFDDCFMHLVDRFEKNSSLLDHEATATSFSEACKFRTAASLQFDKIERERQRQILKDLKAWLSPLSFDDIQRCEDVVCDYPDTGRWLLCNQRFNAWRDGNLDPVLWLSGIPGSGKTILSYIVWNHLKVRSQPSSSTASALFLSDRNRNVHSAVSILRTIAYNLLDADTLLCPLLTEVMEDSSSNLTTRTRKSMEDIIHRIISNTELKRIWVIIDGLDEIDDVERQRAMDFLIKITKSHGTLFRVLISSRKTSAISEVLINLPQIISNDENRADIGLYIDSEQRRLAERFGLGKAEAKDILRSLRVRSEGMFLFARLVIYNLNHQTSLAELREAALDIPNGLDEAYSRILTRIDKLRPNERRLAIDILEFLACAARPPRLLEIKRVLTIGANSKCFDRDRQIFRQPDELCGPIVEVRQESLFYVHFSAKEYLIRQESGPFLDRSLAHHKMAARCLSFLQFSCFEENLTDESIMNHIRNGNYVWLSYVEANWLQHVRLASPAGHFSDLEKPLYSFLHRWQQHQKPLAYAKKVGDKFGLGPLIEAFPDASDTLVQVAIYESQGQFGHVKDPLTLHDYSKKIWRRLDRYVSTEDGSDQEIQDDMRHLYGDHLFRCAEFTCPCSVDGFVTAHERDAHNKMHERPYKCSVGTCQFYRIGFRSSHELATHSSIHDRFVIEKLSNLHISTSQRDEQPERRADDFLLDALDADDVDQVSALIADASIPDSLDLLLHKAVERDAINTSRLLLENAADPNSIFNKSVFGFKCTTLGNATSTAMTELLLEHGADVHGVSTGGVFPLARAILRGNVDQVRILLQHGADANQAGAADIPLALASDFSLNRLKPFSLRKEMISILLEFGADVNRVSMTGDTTLTRVIRVSSGSPRDSACIVKQLIEAGADPSRPNGYRKTGEDYALSKKLPKHIGMTWEELVEQNLHKVHSPTIQEYWAKLKQKRDTKQFIPWK